MRDDGELRRGGVAPDRKARLFADLVLPHLDDVLTLAKWLTGNAHDAEDVTQETCVRALKALDRGPVMNPRAWLLAIARNTAFTFLKRDRAGTVLAGDDELKAVADDSVPLPDAALIAAADSASVAAALAALPLSFRDVLVLREIHDLSYREIAEATGVPIGTVMSRLARARRLMLAALKGQTE